MKNWKPASAVFFGGTSQIVAIKGRRVRPKTALFSAALFDPIHNRHNTVDLKAGSIGFVANPHPQAPALLLAFPQLPMAAATTLEALMRGPAVNVVVINEPTFRMQFEVEVS